MRSQRILDHRMAMWTAWWFQPGQGPPLEEIAEMIADNAVHLVRRSTPAKRGAKVADLTREIRENLSLIERLAQAGPD